MSTKSVKKMLKRVKKMSKSVKKCLNNDPHFDNEGSHKRPCKDFDTLTGPH